MLSNELTVVGLFAGVGGIEKGFEHAGFRTISANEIDPYASETYALNHVHKLVTKDIAKVSGIELLDGTGVQQATVLTGGFPCQPFSVAGYRKGFDDDRGNVFWDILRLIQELQPEVVFLENVKNLKTHDDSNTFKTIEAALRGELESPAGLKLSSGYFVTSAVLNSKDFGIPQNRERIYIVAFKNKDAFERFTFPEPSGASPKPLKDFIDFANPVAEKYYYRESKPFYKELESSIKDENTVYQWRRHYVRENKSGLCPTLTANMGMGGHNVPLVKTKFGIRKLTPIECFRLMGMPNPVFPEKMAESRLYKQAGNAVVVTVIEQIALKIKQALGN